MMYFDQIRCSRPGVGHCVSHCGESQCSASTNSCDFVLNALLSHFYKKHGYMCAPIVPLCKVHNCLTISQDKVLDNFTWTCLPKCESLHLSSNICPPVKAWNSNPWKHLFCESSSCRHPRIFLEAERSPAAQLSPMACTNPTLPYLMATIFDLHPQQLSKKQIASLQGLRLCQQRAMQACSELCNVLCGALRGSGLFPKSKASRVSHGGSQSH